MKMKVEIETQTFVRFWLVVLGFIVLLGSIYLAKGALITIGVALFLALALNPPVTALAAKLPGKSRVGATALAYLIVVTLLGGILFLVVPPIIQQTAKFTATVPSLIDKATSQRPVLDDFVEKYNLKNRKYIVLAPGASKVTKEWIYYEELANKLAAVAERRSPALHTNNALKESPW